MAGMLVVLLLGCGSTRTRQTSHGAGKGVMTGVRFGVIGAGIGAVLGAIGGAIVGHDSHASGEGAGIGAFMGALVGGFLEGAVSGEPRPSSVSDNEVIKRLEELKELIEAMKEQLSGMKEVPEQLQEMGSSVKEIQKKLDDLKTAVESLLKQAAETGKMPAETIPVLEGIREEVGLQDIHFEFDQSRITDDARRVLERNFRWLKAHSRVQISIEGHCDERGTTEYNLALGDRRAKEARRYLINLGINPSQLTRTVSFGEERPLDPGHNEQAWAKNRRAHFVVVNPLSERGLPPPKFPK